MSYKRKASAKTLQLEYLEARQLAKSTNSLPLESHESNCQLLKPFQENNMIINGSLSWIRLQLITVNIQCLNLRCIHKLINATIAFSRVAASDPYRL
nr:hypothetical protein Iba_scaffold29901CG0030 [Ipomoea batatas]GMD19462.1 hypothetical protein Iba_chr07eCG8460 [Ipomoea batatas]